MTYKQISIEDRPEGKEATIAEKQHDGFDCTAHIFEVKLLKCGNVRLSERCDCCFLVERSKQETIEMMEELIHFIKNS